MLVLIAYDTSSDARRRRFARLLQAFGERVQHSVFEAWLTDEQLASLQRQLSPLIDTTDSVIIIPVSARGLQQVRLLGRAQLHPVPTAFVA